MDVNRSPRFSDLSENSDLKHICKLSVKKNIFNMWFKL